jgi:hypothetical protein
LALALIAPFASQEKKFDVDSDDEEEDGGLPDSALELLDLFVEA